MNSSANTTIVFCAGNIAILDVLRLIEALSLPWSNLSVGICAVFHCIDTRLSTTKTRRLLTCKRAGLHTLIDSLLLIELTLIDYECICSRCPRKKGCTKERKNNWSQSNEMHSNFLQNGHAIKKNGSHRANSGRRLNATPVHGPSRPKNIAEFF